MQMETHASEYALSNVQKSKSNVSKNNLLMDAYKMISVFTKVLPTTELSFAMVFVQ